MKQPINLLRSLPNGTLDPLALYREKTGTSFDDPNYDPWDSVAKELISGDTAATAEAYAETMRYAEILKKRNRILTLRSKINTAKRQVEEMEKLNAWLTNLKAVPIKVEASSWHKIKQAHLTGNIIHVNPDVPELYFEEFITGDDPQIFLMQNQWSEVFDISSTGTEDLQVRLPFDKCCFEFQIGGRRLNVLCSQEGDTPYFVIAISCFDDLWFVGKKYDLIQFVTDYRNETGVRYNYVLDEIIALSICLDSEVLTTDVIRAPSKLNAARVKQGKVPVSDYHIVSLARRHRISNPLESASDGSRIGKTRLHFRRGHWRHYVDHKTWIRWQLVGNPDMGRVIKEYRA